MHATLADVIADTAQNSIEAGARHVSVSVSETGGRISVRIEDDGKGMDEAVLAKAFNPFFTEPGKHDRRKVGLGLPILKQICESTGGDVKLVSKKGEGTLLEYWFSAGHIDLPPMGNLATAVLALFNYPGDFDLSFSHETSAGSYSVSRSELAEAVGGLDTADGLSMAKEFLVSQEGELHR
ncbi:MAG: sensor histidine kinase [Kiritimatiellae bacterium]|nr:sensor histidine kinase [Kiritimatiellia bacterium]